MKQVILGTAGHIDHGKTTLIKALTGIDTDRLKEEKERGITIELGFAHMELPDGQVLGIVDVPGHEKFVKNMVAGVTGIDIVAPQDYAGRTHDIDKAIGNAHRNAEALERLNGPMRESGVTLWSNCETFVLEGTPDGRRACVPGPIERIRQQIEIQSPLVEKLITWIYPGVMNRRTDLVNIGHHSTDKLYRQYVDYLKAKSLMKS